MAKAWRTEGLTAMTGVDEAAAVVIALKLGELRHHAERADSRTDPEDLHAMRVASRRLRAALDLLGGPLAELTPGVRRLGQALGQLRDHDVTIEWLEEALRGAGDDERAGIQRLVEEWRAELPPLEQLVREARAAFETHVARAIELRIDEAGWPAPLGGKRLRRRIARRLERLDGRIADAAELGVAHVEAVHALRIAGKKLRYELELVEDVFVPVAHEALERLRALQALLGEVHDADVRLAMIPRRLVDARREEQPGMVRLLSLAFAARDRNAALLERELVAWQEHAAHRYARRIVDGE